MRIVITASKYAVSSTIRCGQASEFVNELVEDLDRLSPIVTHYGKPFAGSISVDIFQRQQLNSKVRILGTRNAFLAQLLPSLRNEIEDLLLGVIIVIEERPRFVVNHFF